MRLNHAGYVMARDRLEARAYLVEALSRVVVWDNEKYGAEMLLDKHLAIVKSRRAYEAACYELRERMTV